MTTTPNAATHAYQGDASRYAVTLAPRRGNTGRTAQAVTVVAVLDGEGGIPAGATVTVPRDRVSDLSRRDYFRMDAAAEQGLTVAEMDARNAAELAAELAADADRAADIERIAYAMGVDHARMHALSGRHDDYPLSGEWADDITANDVTNHVMRELNLHDDDFYSDEFDAAADAFERGYAEAASTPAQPDTYAVHVCADCAMWSANRDDSGADSAWSRDAYAAGLAEYGDDAELILGDGEAEFRSSACDVCGALPGDQYPAEVFAEWHAR